MRKTKRQEFRELASDQGGLAGGGGDRGVLPALPSAALGLSAVTQQSQGYRCVCLTALHGCRWACGALSSEEGPWAAAPPPSEHLSPGWS